jgi:hypothetical protein
MHKKPESGMDRLKKFALWQWGLIVIMAGVISNLLMRLTPPSGDAAAQRAVVLGRGVASLLFLVVGLVLIVLHFARRNRR